MYALRWALAATFAAGLAGCRPATTRPVLERTAVSDRVVGVWDLYRSDGDMPSGAVVTFGRDGKMTVSEKGPDGKTTEKVGTYAAEGGKVTTTVKDLDGKEHRQTLTIFRLTDRELITQDQNGRRVEFRKK